MRSKSLRLIPKLVIVATITHAALGQQTQAHLGVIGGVVVDEKGKAVAGANVNADSPDLGSQQTFVKYVETDHEGRFEIRDLKFGNYQVYAMKESEGYANSYFSLYSNGLTFKATLSAKTPSAEMLIIIGPKAGIISGTIADAKSGNATGATIRIWRLSNESNAIAVSVPATYRVLVPSGMDVAMEVKAAGYDVWRFPGDVLFTAKPLHLDPGRTMRLDVKLGPKFQ